MQSIKTNKDPLSNSLTKQSEPFSTELKIIEKESCFNEEKNKGSDNFY